MFGSSAQDTDQADADDVWLNPSYAAPPITRPPPRHDTAANTNDPPQSDAMQAHPAVDASQGVLQHPSSASAATAVAAGAGAGFARAIAEDSLKTPSLDLAETGVMPGPEDGERAGEVREEDREGGIGAGFGVERAVGDPASTQNYE